MATNKSYTKDEQERIDAVNRYLKGERPVDIFKTFGRSKGWLYKWIGRYNNAKREGKRKWFQEHSRAAKTYMARPIL